MNPAIAQGRIGELWDSLGRDAAELQERIGDDEGQDLPALTAARRTLAALNAAVAALAQVYARLSS